MQILSEKEEEELGIRDRDGCGRDYRDSKAKERQKRCGVN